MYIRVENNEHLLIRTMPGADGLPREVVLANLGQDAELNLFITAESERRSRPELWEGVSDFHLLQALENYKRRMGGFKPALVGVKGNRRISETKE